MGFIKMRVNILILKVEKIDPFVMLNIQILYLLLDFESIEGCGVHDGQYTIYKEVFFDRIIVESVDTG